MMTTEYLFVYGTLRKDFEQNLMHTFGDAATFVDFGEIEGVLYDLGTYPGAAKGSAKSFIRGEIFAVNSDVVFPVLDEYEGEEYIHDKVAVKTDSVREIKAFVYWFDGNVSEAQRIQEDDYLLYLKNRKERCAEMKHYTMNLTFKV